MAVVADTLGNPEPPVQAGRAVITQDKVFIFAKRKRIALGRELILSRGGLMVSGARLDPAEVVSAYRVFPRLFSVFYLYCNYQVIVWFMALPAPSMEQAGFAGTFAATAAAWFKFYVEGGKNG